MMVLPLVLLVQVRLMWAYLGEVMDEQRDSTASDGTILPLRMVANILRLRLDVGWVLLICACVRLQEFIYLQARWHHVMALMLRGSGPRSGGIISIRELKSPRNTGGETMMLIPWSETA